MSNQNRNVPFLAKLEMSAFLRAGGTDGRGADRVECAGAAGRGPSPDHPPHRTCAVAFPTSAEQHFLEPPRAKLAESGCSGVTRCVTGTHRSRHATLRVRYN